MAKMGKKTTASGGNKPLVTGGKMKTSGSQHAMAGAKTTGGKKSGMQNTMVVGISGKGDKK
jgi:hypothetical protein